SVQGIPAITPPDLSPADRETFEIPEASMSPGPTPTPPPEPASDIASVILSIIFLLFGLAAAALIVFFVVRALLRLWRDRPLRARDGGEVEFAAAAPNGSQEADAEAPAIRRGIDGALRSLDERVTPGDAIVAAW